MSFPSPLSSRNTAIIPSLRPDYSPEQLAHWQQRHAALVQQACQGGIAVAFFGDSITEQWLTAGRAEWDRHFAPLPAGNFGIGGDRTQQVLWRMQNGELDGLGPKLVVLLIGTNNTDPGMGGESSLTPRNSPAEIVAGVGAILACVQARLPSTRVLLHGVLPRGPADAPVRAAIAEINAGLKGFDDGGRTVRFYDCGSVFLSADGSIGSDIMPDQLHLSESGYQLWAGHLAGPVREMLRE